MRRARFLLPWVIGILFSGDLAAQQVTVQTPYHSVSDSFFEHIGASWGLNFRGGGTFRFGGNGNLAAPQFGGFTPGAGLTTGFGFTGGRDLSGAFNLTAAQGFRQSFVSQTPVLTLMNGQQGFVSDTSQSPFVIGMIPVVGSGFGLRPPPAPTGMSGVGSDAVRAALEQAHGGQAALPMEPENGPAGLPAVPPRPRANPADRANLGGGAGPIAPASNPAGDPLAERLASAQLSSAGRAVPSVEEARRLRAAEGGQQDNQAAVDWERGISAEEAGNLGAARIYYQMAARRATGELKQKALDRVTALKTARNDGE